MKTSLINISPSEKADISINSDGLTVETYSCLDSSSGVWQNIDLQNMYSHDREEYNELLNRITMHVCTVRLPNG